MLRSVLSIMVGYGLIAISVILFFFSSDVSDPEQITGSFMLFSIGFSFCVAVAGGFVTAIIARRAEVQHGIGLGVLIAMLSGVSISITADQAPLWFQIAYCVAGVTGALAGAFLRSGRGAFTNELDES